MSIVSLLKTKPFFVILIPVFFVLHGFLYFFGFIEPKDALLLALFYCTGVIILFFLLWKLYRRNWQKASIITGYLISAYLFFGAYHDFLSQHFPFLGHYSILLSFILLGLFILIWIVKRTASFNNIIGWINLLFIVYLVIDVFLVAVNYAHPPKNKFSIEKDAAFSYKQIPDTAKPDIYYIVFDEYASSLALQENYGYKNDIDAFLMQKGFNIQSKSFSNYNYTPASVASIMNMSFITGVKDSSLLTAKDMNYCGGLIKYNQVVKYLSALNYEIVNCSHFNLLNNPVTVNDAILPVKTGLINDNTLFAKIKRDIWGDINYDPFLKFMPWKKVQPDQSNLKIVQMIKDQSRKKVSKPVFVFGHVYMPHAPFFYDKNNQLRDPSLYIKDEANPAPAYLNYLSYVNQEMMRIVDTIQQNTGNKAVIMIMGDHGFRGREIYKNLRKNYQNLNAVYLPRKDYHLFYDSISGVNQFRVLFNTLFNQSIPLLKDSTIFLTGKY